MGVRITYGFIPFPWAIVDEGIELSLGEYRLLGYLLRHRTRLGHAAIRLTQDDVLNGRKRRDGSRIDKGCLITNARDLIAARNALAEKGWLELTPIAGGGMEYKLKIDTGDPEDEVVQNEPAKGGGGLVQNEPVASSKRTSLQVQNEPANKGIIRDSIDGLLDGLPLLPSASAVDKPPAKKKTKPSKEEKPADPRFKPTVDLYFQLYMQKKGCAYTGVPWGDRCAPRWKSWLAQHPNVPLDELILCIRNHFASPKRWFKEPAKWMFLNDDLLEYGIGPRDQFGNPLEGGQSGFIESDEDVPRDAEGVSASDRELLNARSAAEEQERQQAERDRDIAVRKREWLKAHGYPEA